MELILANERRGWISFFATFAIAGVFALFLRSRGWRKLWPLAVVVVVHPGWWLSARGGDCGGTLVQGSIVMTIVAPIVGFVMWWRARHAATNWRSTSLR
jgi:hypothetical protein